jgi:hypothetical protein
MMRDLTNEVAAKCDRCVAKTTIFLPPLFFGEFSEQEVELTA